MFSLEEGFLYIRYRVDLTEALTLGHGLWGLAGHSSQLRSSLQPGLFDYPVNLWSTCLL